jgi:hypothetical protein
MARMLVVRAAFTSGFAGSLQAAAGRDQAATRGMSDALAGIELFHCQRQNARLTTAACGRQWAKANGLTKDYRGRPYEVQPWESLFQCRGCPIGAGRNGRSVDPMGEGRRAIANLCPRCLRLTDRMVRVHGDPDKPLCVSCTNRQYELEKGRNAKGGKPEKLRLRSVTLMVIEEGQSRVVTVDGVASAAEAVMRLARKATRPLQFLPVPMLPPGVPLNPQFTDEDVPEWLEDEEEEDDAPPAAARIVSRLVCEEVCPPAPILLSAVLQVHTAELSSPPKPRLPKAYRWMMDCTAFTNRPPFRPHRLAA